MSGRLAPSPRQLLHHLIQKASDLGQTPRLGDPERPGSESGSVHLPTLLFVFEGVLV